MGLFQSVLTEAQMFAQVLHANVISDGDIQNYAAVVEKTTRTTQPKVKQKQGQREQS